MANTNNSTQKTGKKGGILEPALDMTFLGLVSSEIWDQLKTNFSILGANPGAYRTVLGIIATETGRNINRESVKRKHPTTSKLGTTGSIYWNHNIIKIARKQLGDSNPNLIQGLEAHSLMAVMGWNNVRGLGDKFPYLLIEYKTVAEANGLLVNAGEDIDAIYTADTAGMRKAVIAGMAILESKYKAFLNKKFSPTQALVAATRAYLGIGQDQTGTTVTRYLSLVTSAGLRLSTLSPIGKTISSIISIKSATAALSNNTKSTIQTNATNRTGQQNIVDQVGAGSYIPPNTVNSSKLSPGLISSAGLTPNFAASVPPVPRGASVEVPGLVTPIQSDLNFGSPTSTVNGATVDSSGILNTKYTIYNKATAFSKPIVNFSGLPLYTFALGYPVEKPPVSFLDHDSGLVNIGGVTYPSGGKKPVGPVGLFPVINVNTGMVTYGGTITNDLATMVAAQDSLNGIMGTKDTAAGAIGAAGTDGGTPVPQPGC